MNTIQSALEVKAKKGNQAFFRLVDQLAKSVNKIDDKTYEAPGPTEAWAWLMLNVDLPGASLNTKLGKARAIYRGHSNAEWRLSPTLLRQEEEQRQSEEKACQHFADIVYIEFQALWNSDTLVSWPPLHRDSGIAAAQHYGIQTKLLDWTSSYAVALDFATKKADGNKAAIWWTYLSETDKKNFRVVLAPPYIQRLYVQRGLFTAITTMDDVQNLEDNSYKIVFPSLCHEKVKVDHDNQVKEFSSLLPSSPWFDELQKYCTSNQGRKNYDKTGNAAERSMLFDTHLASFDNEILRPWQYVIEDLGLRTWFGEDGILRQIPDYILALGQRSSDDGTIGLDGEVVRLIKQEDPELLDWAMPLIKAYVNEIKK